MPEKNKSNCRHLRTKMSYIHDPDFREEWRTEGSSTSQYWCLRTMTTVGPDDFLVAPQECHSGRSCYLDKFTAD